MAPACSPAARAFGCSTTPPAGLASPTAPFAETKELIAGFTLIEVPSHEEALSWAKRFPAPFPGQPCCIEVRPLMGGIDMPPEDAERLIREQLAAIKRAG